MRMLWASTACLTALLPLPPYLELEFHSASSSSSHSSQVSTASIKSIGPRSAAETVAEVEGVCVVPS